MCRRGAAPAHAGQAGDQRDTSAARAILGLTVDAAAWARRSARGGMAGRAQTEELDAVLVDPVAGPLGDLLGDGLDPAIVDVGALAAVRADDVVVVLGLADDVGVLAGWQVDPLDDAELLEQLQGAEHGGPADARSLRVSVGHEVRGREVA